LEKWSFPRENSRIPPVPYYLTSRNSKQSVIVKFAILTVLETNTLKHALPGVRLFRHFTFFETNMDSFLLLYDMQMGSPKRL